MPFQVEQANQTCIALIELAVQVNSEKTEFSYQGLTLLGKPIGDWKVTVEKVVAAEEGEADLSCLSC